VDTLRIFIDPDLIKRHGPEIHWTWRLLFSGIGWSWQEVGQDEACEVAYVSPGMQIPGARVVIVANPLAWKQPDIYRLQQVSQSDGLASLVFAGVSSVSESIYTEAGQIICQHDLVFDIFWLVTGQEERYWPKDKHGFHDLTGSSIYKHLNQAVASQICLWFENTLTGLGYPPPYPRWPNNKRAAAGIGHDVDYPEVKRWLEPGRVIMRHGLKGFGPALEILVGQRTHWQFPAWVKLEKSLQTPSAFYFVPRQGSLWEYVTRTPDPFYDVTSERFRQLFCYLTDEGFEIGLHASYLAYQSRDQFAAEKQKLEQASGQLVIGNRHHYWHLNPDNAEETLLIHEQIDLKYDASLIFERYLGWRRGWSYPFFPFHQAQRRELKTLQLPTAWMDDQLFGHRVDNPGEPDHLLQTLADRVAEQGSCLLIDIHDYVFDDALFPNWTRTFSRLWEYMLNRGDFWFVTPAQMANHWTTRYHTLVQASCGLNEGMA
jgi:hypothetical protein